LTLTAGRLNSYADCDEMTDIRARELVESFGAEHRDDV